MLEPGTLAEMLEQLRAEQTAAETELVVLQRRVNSLRQAVSGIEGLLEAKIPVVDVSEEASALKAATAQLDATSVTVTGSGAIISAPDRPRGAEAIRRVLAENEGTGWTVRAMTAELERRGWTPESKKPIDAVRTAMVRLWKAPNSGVLRQDSEFFYRPSRNGDGPSAHREEAGSDQEVSGTAPTFTEGEQRS